MKQFVTILCVFLLLPYAQCQIGYEDLFKNMKIKEGALAFYNVNNLDKVTLHGSIGTIEDKNISELLSSARKGNIAALYLLATFTDVSEIDKVLDDNNNTEDSIFVSKKRKAFMYYNLIATFSSEEKELNSIISVAHYNLAKFYLDGVVIRKNEESAIFHLKKALISEELKGMSLIKLASIYKNIGEKTNADYYYKQCFDFGKNDFRTSKMISRSYEQGKFGLKVNKCKSKVWKYRSQRLKKESTFKR
jgi:TPR repeat protein